MMVSFLATVGMLAARSRWRCTQQSAGQEANNDLTPKEEW